MLNRSPGGSAFCWLSLPQLVSNSSDLQLSDFLSSPSYIIVQSPTQSLEWHVWSSSSRNNCHAVHRSLSSGASVYECIMGFYLVPFRQPNPPTRFLSITGHWNVTLPSGASLWNGMFGRVEGQYTTQQRDNYTIFSAPKLVLHHSIQSHTQDIFSEVGLLLCAVFSQRIPNLASRSENIMKM